jgi:hypothetical protein
MVRDTLIRGRRPSGASNATAAESALKPVEVCARPTDGELVSATHQPRSLRLRRADHCAVCRTALPAGTTATWHPGRHVVTCLGCVPDAAAADPVAAGAAARRLYERRHAAREDRARQKLGPLGVVLARMTDEPQSTRAWKTGADGEERVGARLAELLADTEVKLLHDRRMPGRGAANIDHVAIGPGGITVIDTKNYRGKVRTERIGGLFTERRTVLMIAGRDRTHLIDSVERQIAAVRTIAERLSAQPIDIRGALCFANPDGLPLLRSQSARDILMDGTRSVAKLARRRGTLDNAAISVLYQGLSSALPAA